MRQLVPPDMFEPEPKSETKHSGALSCKWYRVWERGVMGKKCIIAENSEVLVPSTNQCISALCDSVTVDLKS